MKLRLELFIAHRGTVRSEADLYLSLRSGLCDTCVLKQESLGRWFTFPFHGEQPNKVLVNSLRPPGLFYKRRVSLLRQKSAAASRPGRGGGRTHFFFFFFLFFGGRGCRNDQSACFFLLTFPVSRQGPMLCLGKFPFDLKSYLLTHARRCFWKNTRKTTKNSAAWKNCIWYAHVMLFSNGFTSCEADVCTLSWTAEELQNSTLFKQPSHPTKWIECRQPSPLCTPGYPLLFHILSVRIVYANSTVNAELYGLHWLQVNKYRFTKF